MGYVFCGIKNSWKIIQNSMIVASVSSKTYPCVHHYTFKELYNDFRAINVQLCNLNANYRV